MSLVLKIRDTLIYSNFFIGFGAVALALTNELTIGEELYWNDSLWFVFFSTVFTYSFLKFRNKGRAIVRTSHHEWADSHPQLSRNIILISLIITVFCFARLPYKAQMIVAALAVVTAFYGFVDIPFSKPKRKLRDFGMLKTVFVAVVWSVTTVIVPLGDTSIDFTMMMFLLMRRFLFILALTVPFEIKDMKSDREHQLSTLALRHGVTNTKLLAQGVLVLLMLVLFIQYFAFELSLANMLAVNLSLLVSILCIQPITEETEDTWYYLVLDGMMIFQFVFVYIAISLFS